MQASPGAAAAPTAGGARLEVMRRRVRFSRLALWAAIASGPIALAVAVASSTPTVRAATPAQPAPSRSTTAAAEAAPAGYAQLFVSAWLRSTTSDPSSAQARLAQSMAPSVELPESAGAQAGPASVTVLRSARRGSGVWSVTVAAQYTDGTVRYYAVPVAAGASGTSFAVTGAPGVVAGPGRAAVAKSPYGVSVRAGDLTSAIGRFLGAYLTGAGEVERYLAPGVKLSAVSPAPFQGATVQRISAAETAAAAERVPADGTTVRVLATVEARDRGGRWPLAYELALKARSGRWEITALESGAAQDGGSR
ncbi:conjugal transfer protein [Streptomyces sp. TLI_146]|uniref:conjugal transfer protein n=1 Tax=Streptomyces sp. TLI_146 TaxID=1938858 RepID=UPI00214CD4CE|nr:conjugal transfer protein [Streptomyces sp. TLI_146]